MKKNTKKNVVIIKFFILLIIFSTTSFTKKNNIEQQPKNHPAHKMSKSNIAPNKSNKKPSSKIKKLSQSNINNQNPNTLQKKINSLKQKTNDLKQNNKNKHNINIKIDQELQNEVEDLIAKDAQTENTSNTYKKLAYTTIIAGIIYFTYSAIDKNPSLTEFITKSQPFIVTKEFFQKIGGNLNNLIDEYVTGATEKKQQEDSENEKKKQDKEKQDKETKENDANKIIQKNISIIQANTEALLEELKSTKYTMPNKQPINKDITNAINELKEISDKFPNLKASIQQKVQALINDDFIKKSYTAALISTAKNFTHFSNNINIIKNILTIAQESNTNDITKVNADLITKLQENLTYIETTIDADTFTKNSDSLKTFGNTIEKPFEDIKKIIQSNNLPILIEKLSTTENVSAYNTITQNIIQNIGSLSTSDYNKTNLTNDINKFLEESFLQPFKQTYTGSSQNIKLILENYNLNFNTLKTNLKNTPYENTLNSKNYHCATLLLLCEKNNPNNFNDIKKAINENINKDKTVNADSIIKVIYSNENNKNTLWENLKKIINQYPAPANDEEVKKYTETLQNNINALTYFNTQDSTLNIKSDLENTFNDIITENFLTSMAINKDDNFEQWKNTIDKSNTIQSQLEKIAKEKNLTLEKKYREYTNMILTLNFTENEYKKLQNTTIIQNFASSKINKALLNNYKNVDLTQYFASEIIPIKINTIIDQYKNTKEDYTPKIKALMDIHTTYPQLKIKETLERQFTEQIQDDFKDIMKSDNFNTWKEKIIEYNKKLSHLEEIAKKTNTFALNSPYINYMHDIAKLNLTEDMYKQLKNNENINNENSWKPIIEKIQKEAKEKQAKEQKETEKKLKEKQDAEKTEIKAIKDPIKNNKLPNEYNETNHKLIMDNIKSGVNPNDHIPQTKFDIIKNSLTKLKDTNYSSENHAALNDAKNTLKSYDLITPENKLHEKLNPLFETK